MKTLFFCILVVLSTAYFALAAVPNTLSYQGTLTDQAGNPITATKTIDFKLYNVAIGGAAQWAETQTVTVASGRFGVVLGVVTPFDKSILTGNTWIGITVQGETEMAPRQKLTSVAYALVAETVADPTALTPPGMVSAYAGSAAPAGWLLCDGSQVSRSTYAKLFTAIGTAHGIGDGSTTFHIPDYRGRFLRGVDGTAGNDLESAVRTFMNTGGNVGNVVGTLQQDAFLSHNHLVAGKNINGYANSVSAASGASSIGIFEPWFITPHYSSDTGGIETRPKNVSVNWIVKY